MCKLDIPTLTPVLESRSELSLPLEGSFSLAISLNNLAAGKDIVQWSEANLVMTFLAFCFASMGLISIRRWDLMRLQNGPDAMCLLTPELTRRA